MQEALTIAIPCGIPRWRALTVPLQIHPAKPRHFAFCLWPLRKLRRRLLCIERDPENRHHPQIQLPAHRSLVCQQRVLRLSARRRHPRILHQIRFMLGRQPQAALRGIIRQSISNQTHLLLQIISDRPISPIFCRITQSSKPKHPQIIAVHRINHSRSICDNLQTRLRATIETRKRCMFCMSRPRRLHDWLRRNESADRHSHAMRKHQNTHHWQQRAVCHEGVLRVVWQNEIYREIDLQRIAVNPRRKVGFGAHLDCHERDL
mmetsp:Transcript_66676/g.105974  ORF Transcript_66676/g.105974 Transcript_66676/m.105974 type:complete len:262 (+) Transcript_66676:143-928(+)